MLSFSHTIDCVGGFHARPVALVAAEARRWASRVTVKLERTGAVASANDLMGLMVLDARCGDTLTVSVCGKDEALAAEAMRSVFDF